MHAPSRLLATCLLALLAWPAAASLRIHTSQGVPVRWFAGDLPLRFTVQLAGSDDVPDTSDDLAVRRAFDAWAALPEVDVAIEEETDPAERARTDWQADDTRLVIFDEDGDASLFPPNSGIVAVTPLQYVVSSGRIVDGDIVLNGDESDFATDGDAHAFDVRAVVTHEVGHLLGLAHSALGHATMAPFVTGGGVQPRTLTADDRAGLAGVYPSGAAVAGAVEGRVRRAGGKLVSGAHVHARGPDGRVGAATFSDADGRYVLDGLAPGDYELVVAPVNGPLLPAQLVNPAGLPPFEVDFQAAELALSVGGGLVVAPDLVVGPDAALRIVAPPLAWPIHVGETREVTLRLQGWVAPGQVSVLGAGGSIEVADVEFVPASKELRFDVEVEPYALPGGYDLRLTSSAGATALAPGFLEVLPRAPDLDAVEPGCGLASGGALLTLDGEALDTVVEVRVGEGVAPAVVVVADDQLLATQPAGAAGQLDVVVLTAGGEEARLAQAFGAGAGVAPTPLALFPAAGSTSGGTKASLTGVDLEPGDGVRVGGVPASVVYVDEGRLDLELPALPAGAHDLLVVDGACDAVTALLPGAWTAVAAPDPFIGGVTPDEAAHVGGELVTILGDGFVDGAGVELQADLTTGAGGLVVPTLFADAQTLHFVMPPLPLGPATLLVRLPDGRVATAADALSVRALLDGKDKLDGELSEPGETDEVWIDGLAGTRFSATLKRRAKSDLVPKLELRSAAGEVLLSSDPAHPAFDGALVKSAPARASLRKVVLPATERYVLELGGLDGSLGAYRLSLKEQLPPEAKALALPKASAPSAGPDALTLPLLAKPGSTVSGKLRAGDALQLVFVSLVDPDGALLLDDEPDGLSGPPQLMDAVTLDPEGRFIRFKKLPLETFGEHVLTLGAAPGTSGPITGKLTIKPPKGKTKLTE